jgi:hypothetical protein
VAGAIVGTGGGSANGVGDAVGVGLASDADACGDGVAAARATDSVERSAAPIAHRTATGVNFMLPSS